MSECFHSDHSTRPIISTKGGTQSRAVEVNLVMRRLGQVRTHGIMAEGKGGGEMLGVDCVFFFVERRRLTSPATPALTFGPMNARHRVPPPITKPSLLPPPFPPSHLVAHKDSTAA